MFQAYDFFGGTAGTGLDALTAEQRWFVTALGGGGTVTETRLMFSGEGLGGGSRVAKSSTIDGTYNSIGGTVSGSEVASDVINSFSYFAIGTTSDSVSGPSLWEPRAPIPNGDSSHRQCDIETVCRAGHIKSDRRVL